MYLKPQENPVHIQETKRYLNYAIENESMEEELLEDLSIHEYLNRLRTINEHEQYKLKPSHLRTNRKVKRNMLGKVPKLTMASREDQLRLEQEQKQAVILNSGVEITRGILSEKVIADGNGDFMDHETYNNEIETGHEDDETVQRTAYSYIQKLIPRAQDKNQHGLLFEMLYDSNLFQVFNKQQIREECIQSRC
jgi:hypothetical protein